jgi:UDPglucose 6-dehydrogenase
VRLGIGADTRIGYEFIDPGCGYGGSCFPKDIRALNQISLENLYQPRLLKAVDDINNDQKEVLFNKFYHYFEGNIKGKIVSVWGLSFKPNTDDIREAPSRTLIERLWDYGVKVKAYDPKAMTHFDNIYSNRVDCSYVLTENAYDALDDSEALFIVTEWESFRSPDFAVMKKRLRKPLIFDGRNLFDKTRLERLSFEYISIGR